MCVCVCGCLACEKKYRCVCVDAWSRWSVNNIVRVKDLWALTKSHWFVSPRNSLGIFFAFTIHGLHTHTCTLQSLYSIEIQIIIKIKMCTPLFFRFTGYCHIGSLVQKYILANSRMQNSMMRVEKKCTACACTVRLLVHMRKEEDYIFAQSIRLVTILVLKITFHVFFSLTLFCSFHHMLCFCWCYRCRWWWWLLLLNLNDEKTK